MPTRDRPLSDEELERLVDIYTANRIKGRSGSTRPSGRGAAVGHGSVAVVEESQGASGPDEAPREMGEQQAEAPETRLAGTIEIKDGRVIVHGSGGGRKPRIRPGVRARVLVNGKEIDAPCDVGPDDTVEVVPENVAPEVHYRIEVDKDGLSATLAIEKRPGQVVRLVDVPPTPNLRPRGEVVERPLPPDPTQEEILEELQRQGIVFGIAMDVVKAFASGQAKGLQVVARGLAPREGEDGCIEFLFAAGERKPRSDPRTGRVDYLAAEEVPCVEPGETIARRRPPVPGHAGRTVRDEELPPRTPKDVKIVARDGVELVEDGNAAVATRAGRPVQKGEQLFVLPVLVVEGNVGLETGHVSYRGDVVVAGDVEDRLRVEATGRVQVRGNVVRAHVVAQGDIWVSGQVIGARLFAGSHLIYRRLREEFASVRDQLKLLIDTVLRLRESFRARGARVPPDEQLVTFLLREKFKKLSVAAMELARFVDEIEAPLEVEARPLCAMVNRYTHPARRVRVRSLRDLERVHREIEQFIDSMRDFEEAPANFVGNTAHRCEIHVSGGAYIQGQGAYQSDVAARGVVVVNGTFRGGAIASDAGVFVEELGSAAGVRTEVKVAEDAKVRSRRIHPGVRVRLGDVWWECRTLTQNVELARSGDGTVKVGALAQWAPPQPPALN